MSAPPRASRLDPIDRMRGVAILLVVIYHAGPLSFRFPPLGPDGWLRLPDLGLAWLAVPLFHFGFVGVHAFFVLSGFCIHLRGARRRHDPDVRPLGVRDFFLRRFFRIYPPYWIALAIFGLAVPLVARALHRDAAPPSAADLALHATMLHGFFEKTIFSINPAFWSLATEEQFYLAYPLLALALTRFGARRVAVFALLLSLGWRAVVLGIAPPTIENFLFYRVWLHGFFVPRWYEWILGCLLAEAAAAPRSPLAGRARPLAHLGACFLLLGMLCRVHVAIDKLLADACYSTGFAAITGALLARALTPPAEAFGPLARAGQLTGAALAAVGRRAYGTYLVHQPILDGSWLPLPLRLALAALASALFSRVFERPFERRSQRVGEASRQAPVARDVASRP